MIAECRLKRLVERLRPAYVDTIAFALLDRRADRLRQAFHRALLQLVAEEGAEDAGGGGCSLAADALLHLGKAVRNRLARRLADGAENLVDLSGVLLAPCLQFGGMGERQSLLKRGLGLGDLGADDLLDAQLRLCRR